jgi:hypothetical protein
MQSQMQLQIRVPHHIKDHPWQWMKKFSLVLRFATTLQLHGHVMSFETNFLMAFDQGN